MSRPSQSPTYCAPTTATAGETLVWLLAGADTPFTDGWTVAVTCTPSSGSVVTVAGAQEGDGPDFRVTVTAAQTAGLAAGPVRWVALATKGAEGVAIGRGQIEVQTASGLTANETALAALDAAIQGRLTGGIAQYVIAGRQIQYLSPADLQHWRSIYAQRVQTERFGRTRTMRFAFGGA